MSFQQKPTEMDLKNYSYDCKDSAFYENPGKFLKLGQRVRAKFRIWDLPQKTLEANWGWVSAEQGETGTVIHVQDQTWPTVQFDDTGCSTCVTDFEVEPIDVDKQRLAYAQFFDGLGYRLRNPTRLEHGNKLSTKDGFSEAFVAGVEVANGYLDDVQTGSATGISLTDMVKTELLELKY